MASTTVVLVERGTAAMLRRSGQLPADHEIRRNIDELAHVVLDRLLNAGYAKAYLVDENMVVVGVNEHSLGKDNQTRLLDTVCGFALSQPRRFSSQAGLSALVNRVGGPPL